MNKFPCEHCGKDFEGDKLDYLGYCPDCISFSLAKEEEDDRRAEESLREKNPQTAEDYHRWMWGIDE